MGLNKKWLITASVATLALTAATGVYAGSKLQEIKAYLDSGITLKANGTVVQPREGNGNAILPITYNGKTYLPVRAVGDIMGIAVSYDPKTATVELGEKAEGVSIAKGFDGSYHTKDPALTTYLGKDYKDAYFDNNVDSRRGSSFMLYPEGKYQKLILQVAAVGEDIKEIFVQDADSDAKLKIDSVAVKDGLKTLEVDIGGAKKLFIHADLGYNGSMFIPLTTSYFK